MFQPSHVAPLHTLATAHWHDAASPAPVAVDELEALVLQQHRANFDLWHTEDKARAPQVSGEAMIAIKREIDRLNQLRNDLAEQIDTTLLRLAPPQTSAPLHSETPGLMIDRLSILALKMFHTEEETRRMGATPEHRQRNRERLALLTEQRDDLTASLSELWAQVLDGTRRFKLYRQMKMYNDPALNPVLYGTPTEPA
jgi:hypothetical protein